MTAQGGVHLCLTNVSNCSDRDSRSTNFLTQVPNCHLDANTVSLQVSSTASTQRALVQKHSLRLQQGCTQRSCRKDITNTPSTDTSTGSDVDTRLTSNPTSLSADTTNSRTNTLQCELIASNCVQANRPWWLRCSPFLCDEGPNTRSDTHSHTLINGVLSKGSLPMSEPSIPRTALKTFQGPMLWGDASLEVGSLWGFRPVCIHAWFPFVGSWSRHVSQSHQMRSTLAPTSSSDSIFIQDSTLRDATKPKSNHLLLLSQYHSDN